jgi:predicted transcriptional regulator
MVLDDNTPSVMGEKVLKALDSSNRIRILRYLSNRIASISEIAGALEIPLSSTALHVEILEEAGLVRTEFEPANRGLQKICSRMYDQVILDLPLYEQPREQVTEFSMPIGAYVDCQVQPTCGILSETSIIGMLDDPSSFYEPDHFNTQLLWFHQGYVEYRFPNRIPKNNVPSSIRLSMEVCSEAPLYNLNWPSDITVWINGVELGTWTSPSDFGGEPGRLTPEWWTLRNTQYGLLKFWHVDNRESRVDGVNISNVTIGDLNLNSSPYISVRIGVKQDAKHIGGLNLFGSRFGNYPQDLVLGISYHLSNQPVIGREVPEKMIPTS